MGATSKKVSGAKVRPGIYAHYKGGLYRVLQCARQSETGEDVVVYQSLNDDSLWVRPLSMFAERVEAFGSVHKRFTLLTAPDLFSFHIAENEGADRHLGGLT